MNRIHSLGHRSIWLIIIVLSFLLPLALQLGYIQHIMIMAMVYIILTLSLNLIAGNTGYVSFAHPAFYAIGAYTSGILLKTSAIPFLGILLFSGILPMAISIALGYLFFSRVRGFAFAMTTLAFNAIAGLILSSVLPNIVKGVEFQGVYAIPRATISIPPLFTFTLTSNIHYYYFLLCITLPFIGLMSRLMSTKVGRALTAIRENELLAEALGINTLNNKVLAFAIGAFFAGIAGGFLAPYITFVSPDLASAYYWVLFFTMLFAGGPGTLIGPIIGATVFSVLPELLRFAPGVSFTPELRQALFGLSLLLIIILIPDGIGGKIKEIIYRRRARA